jgi:hypothetical protein
MNAAIARSYAVGAGVGLVPFDENKSVPGSAARSNPPDIEPDIGQ